MNDRMGEMSKVEEVARAIAEKYHGRKVTREYLFGEATGGLVFVECAKAAIAAMRKPTLAMCEVAREEAPNSEYDTFDDELMTKWYQSVIDEALKE